MFTAARNPDDNLGWRVAPRDKTDFATRTHIRFQADGSGERRSRPPSSYRLVNRRRRLTVPSKRISKNELNMEIFNDRFREVRSNWKVCQPVPSLFLFKRTKLREKILAFFFLAKNERTIQSSKPEIEGGRANRWARGSRWAGERQRRTLPKDNIKVGRGSLDWKS